MMITLLFLLFSLFSNAIASKLPNENLDPPQQSPLVSPISLLSEYITPDIANIVLEYATKRGVLEMLSNSFIKSPYISEETKHSIVWICKKNLLICLGKCFIDKSVLDGMSGSVGLGELIRMKMTKKREESEHVSIGVSSEDDFIHLHNLCDFPQILELVSLVTLDFGQEWGREENINFSAIFPNTRHWNIYNPMPSEQTLSIIATLPQNGIFNLTSNISLPLQDYVALLECMPQLNTMYIGEGNFEYSSQEEVEGFIYAVNNIPHIERLTFKGVIFKKQHLELINESITSVCDFIESPRVLTAEELAEFF